MNATRVLIAVDGTESAKRAVEYAGEVLGLCSVPNQGVCRHIHARLLYVERLPDKDLFGAEEQWKEQCLEEERKMQTFLKESREILEKQGVPPGAISQEYIVNCASPVNQEGVRYCSTGMSVAEDILLAQKEGEYGTIIIGRRGITKAEEFLFGSISNKIIHDARDCAVWVVE